MAIRPLMPRRWPSSAPLQSSDSHWRSTQKSEDMDIRFIELARQRLKRYAAPNRESGCVEWIGTKDKDGYGLLTINRRQYRAHRLAYAAAVGEMPGGVVMHLCDNPSCISVRHLKSGTVAENNRDRTRKGRTAKGDANGARLYPHRVSEGVRRARREHPEKFARGERVNTAKLTEDDVREIRRRYSSGGLRQVDLAKEYGVTQVQISAIVRRQSWKHILD